MDLYLILMVVKNGNKGLKEIDRDMRRMKV